MQKKWFKLCFLFVLILSFCGCSTTEGEYVDQNVFNIMINGTNQTLSFNEANFNISNKYLVQEVEKDDHYTYLISDVNDKNAYFQGVLYQEDKIEKIKEQVKDDYHFKNFTSSDWVILNTIKNNLLDGTILIIDFEILNFNNNDWVKFRGKNSNIYYLTATDNCAYFITNNSFSDKQMEEILSSITFETAVSFSNSLQKMCNDFSLIDKIEIYNSIDKNFTIGEKV